MPLTARPGQKNRAGAIPRGGCRRGKEWGARRRLSPPASLGTPPVAGQNRRLLRRPVWSSCNGASITLTPKVSPMAVVTCPNCASRFTVSADFKPHKSHCPKCGQRMGEPPQRGSDEENEPRRSHKWFPPLHWVVALLVVLVIVARNQHCCFSDNYIAIAAGGAQIGGWSAFVYLVARAIDRINGHSG